MSFMYEMKKFENGPLNTEVRTLYIEGAVWFVLVDVARSLGYRDATAARHLLRPSQVAQADEAIKKALGVRGSAPYLVNESGFYRLAMKSTKAEAEPFQLWVEDEVLPTIRREGAYVSDSITPEQLEKHRERIRYLEDRVQGVVAGARRHQAELDLAMDQQAKDHRRRIAQHEQEIAVLNEQLEQYRYIIKRSGTDEKIPTRQDVINSLENRVRF